MNTAAVAEPICGKCRKVMTPENASERPELFLHDECLPKEFRMPIEVSPGFQSGQLAVNGAGGGWLGIIDKMLDKGVGPEMLTKVFDMQQQWQKEQARKLFVEAFAAFKAEAPPSIERTGRVGFEGKGGGAKVEYSHVELDHAVDLLAPVMAKHGLAHSWDVQQAADGQISVTCRLEHEAGHSTSVTLRGMADGSGSKNAIQAVGSAVYYLERYTFLAVMGIAQKYQDDDAKKAGAKPLVSEAQIAEFNQLVADIREEGCELNEKTLPWASEGAKTKIERIDQCPATFFPMLIKQVKGQLAQAKKKVAK
jgi:hypothetical protein